MHPRPKTWGWNHDVQATRFRDAFATNLTELQIIQCAAERIGYIQVIEEPTRVFLAAVEIAPSHQRRGIGTSLIEDVCKRGDSIGLPVELQVLKVNPAKHLYERLGFSTQAETETHYLMRRAPGGAA
jgi:ribosomal protein S18 acetylase RimI-like enzyme